MVSALEDNLDMLHMIYDSVQVMQGGYIKVKEQNTVKILDENCEVLLSCDESDFLEFRCGYALVRKGNAVELRWGDTSKILDIEPWDIVRNLRVLDNNILFECKTRSFNYMECRDWIYIADKQGNIVSKIKGVELKKEAVRDALGHVRYNDYDYHIRACEGAKNSKIYLDTYGVTKCINMLGEIDAHTGKFICYGRFKGSDFETIATRALTQNEDEYAFSYNTYTSPHCMYALADGDTVISKEYMDIAQPLSLKGTPYLMTYTNKPIFGLRQGIIDHNGNELIEAKYDNVHYIGDNSFILVYTDSKKRMSIKLKYPKYIMIFSLVDGALTPWVSDIEELNKDLYLVTTVIGEPKIFNFRTKKLIDYTYEELSKNLNTNELNFISQLARH